MKKAILIFLLSVNYVFAQPLTGIMGVPFGSSKADVKAIMKSKYPDADLIQDLSTVLTYTGIKFAGKQTIGIIFSFNFEDHFHTSKVLLSTDIDEKVMDIYEGVVSDIDEKYHRHDHQIEKWSYPYDSSDRNNHLVTAIKMNKLTCQTLWKFPIEGKEDNMIEVTINNKCSVVITYQDGDLITSVVKKNKEKNSQDY